MNRLSRWLIPLFILSALANTRFAEGEEPYAELWAVTGQAFTEELGPEDGTPIWDQAPYVGGEILIRLPYQKWALLGRGTVEGASGQFVMKQPGTWRRLVGEGAVSYQIVAAGGSAEAPRYTCAAFVGSGATGHLGAGEPLRSIPPKFGGGIHCRDAKLRMWMNARAVWDAAQGRGAGLEVSVHAPLYSERAAMGVNLVLAQAPRVEIQAKLLLLKKGRAAGVQQ